MNGFTFVEVLVALVVLSIGLLGIAGIELTAVRNTQRAYFQSIANVQITSMCERLRANLSPTARGKELTLWNLENRQLLPQGHGSYLCQSSFCTVDLSWHDRQLHQMSFQMVLCNYSGCIEDIH